MKIRRRITWILAISLLMVVQSAIAQEPQSCAQLIRAAMATTEEQCIGLGENQACYGHVLVDARPQPGASLLDFNESGDVAELLDIQSLRLSTMDLNSNLWGVALMNLQAHMPFAQPEDVTLVLFGDVDIENQGDNPILIPAHVASSGYVNARLGPSTQAGVLAALAPGQDIIANGRLEDGSWIRIFLPENNRVAWISATLVASESDLEELDVVEPWAPYYGPMQAFYLSSGVDDSLCAEAPESGLMIQTPEGVAEVNLLVNEVNIQLSATAFVQAQPGNQMTVEVLNGWARVETQNQTRTVFAGTQVSIPIDENLTPTGAPGEIEPYDGTGLDSLPVNLLSYVIKVATPLTYDQIASLLNQVEEANGELDAVLAEGGVATDGGASSEGETPPGLDGVLPPGQGGTPPGQGGEPPGQAKK